MLRLERHTSIRFYMFAAAILPILTFACSSGNGVTVWSGSSPSTSDSSKASSAGPDVGSASGSTVQEQVNGQIQVINTNLNSTSQYVLTQADIDLMKASSALSPDDEKALAAFVKN